MGELAGGSLFTGTGALDMAAAMALGQPLRHVWHVDKKPAARALLRHRFPDVPLYDDMRLVHYGRVAPIDILTAGWPCFAGDTIVMTARGGIPISAVVAGDLVLTHRNRWRPVLQAWSKGRAPIRVVRAQGAPPIRTTDDHPFLVRTYRRYVTGTRKVVEKWSEPTWEPAKTAAGWRGAIPATVEPIATPAWPLTPWLVGRWVADGWADNDARRIRFAIGDDKAEKFRAELERAGVTASESAMPGCVRFTIGRTDVGQWLVENFGTGAAGKRTPGWILADPQRGEWLDGYLSGDGFEHRGSSFAVTISRALAVGLVMIGASLGMSPSMKLASPPPRTSIEGRDVNQHPWYRVGLRPSSGRQSARWADGSAWVTIRSSEPTDRAEQVWNLHVAEDNSYTADGLTVHNCQPWSSAGLRLGEDDPRALWPYVARAIEVARPLVFLGENVARITSNGELRRVVGSLADLGYVVAWRVLAAADIGAAHKRARCFVVAVRADAAAGLTLLPTPTPSMTTGAGTSGREGGLNLQTAVTLLPTPKASDGPKGGPGMRGSSGDLALPSAVMAGNWGRYAAAVARWESVIGRPAPAPTQTSPRTGGPQLAPPFVEWLMGLPQGWVCDVPDLAPKPSGHRNAALSLLGDGVVPLQAATAYRELLGYLLSAGRVVA